MTHSSPGSATSDGISRFAKNSDRPTAGSRRKWICTRSDQERIGPNNDYALLITFTPSDADTKRPYRLPVAVGHGQISVDGITVSFVPHDSGSLLRNYLRLVRSMRRQRRAPDVALRRDDIEVLAQYLDETGDVVLDRLAELMGATRTQRVAMLSLFASGALVVGLSTSTASLSVSTTDQVGPRRSYSPVGPDATVVEAEARSLSPGAAVVIETTATTASQATVVGEDTAVPPAVVEIVASAGTGSATVSPAPRVVVAQGSSTGATDTTSGEQLQRDPAAAAVGSPPETTEPPVVVAVEEPPIATAVSIIDSGTPPAPTVPPTTTPTTSPTTTPTTTATSPGGVGEPPLDEPTPPDIDPSLVDVGAPPVPTSAPSNTTPVGP